MTVSLLVCRRKVRTGDLVRQTPRVRLIFDRESISRSANVIQAFYLPYVNSSASRRATSTRRRDVAAIVAGKISAREDWQDAINITGRVCALESSRIADRFIHTYVHTVTLDPPRPIVRIGPARRAFPSFPIAYFSGRALPA